MEKSKCQAKDVYGTKLKKGTDALVGKYYEKVDRRIDYQRQLEAKAVGLVPLACFVLSLRPQWIGERDGKLRITC